ncbi:MAG: hypothetical protein FJ271_03995 [Planctomycetes bacterium]|nr:hypothetical protein [Planctomycetota bacterium]
MRLFSRHAGAVLVVCLCSCGDEQPPTFPVSGKVVFQNGVPVTHAIIEFTRPSGPMARARLAGDGSFALETAGRPGAVAGTHRIAIIPIAIAEDVSPAQHQHGPARAIPAKYRRQETSGLERDIPTGGATDIVIRLVER